MKLLKIPVLFFILTSLNAFAGKATGIVSDLHAEFRNGQVFLIWNESGNNDKNLRVYISKKPITKENLLSAHLLTDQLEPHSANDWYSDPEECPHTSGPVHGWIIEPGHEPLNKQGGLFVHTVLKRDPSFAYFAVLGEEENKDILAMGSNSLEKPIAIRSEPIQAIWQLSGSQPTATNAPMAIFLHSHQGRPSGELTHLFFGDSSMGWREGLPFKFKVSIRPDLVLIEPYDRVWINRKMTPEEAKANGTYDTQFKDIESWWYGTNNKINDPKHLSSGTPTNYTERWILWAMKWAQQNYKTSANQVYAFGASMGTGVLRLVLRNAGRFASVDLLVPILDPFDEGNIGERMKPRVGEPQTICSDGMKLSDRLNTIKSINASKTDIPPIVMRMGRSDKSVYWIRKPDFIHAMETQKQAYFAGWDNGTHSTAMRKHHDAFPNWFDFKWYIDHFALNKSFPAFTQSSLDDNPGNGDPSVGDSTGFINRGFDWDILQDKKSAYRILLTNKTPGIVYPIHVSVTPRRYQGFRHFKQKTVYAYDIDASGKIIEKKVLRVKNGLMTYNAFPITSVAGNTLLIQTNEIL
jgi:hypothetical protein